MTWRPDWSYVPFDEDAMTAHARHLQDEGVIDHVGEYVDNIHRLHTALNNERDRHAEPK